MIVGVLISSIWIEDYSWYFGLLPGNSQEFLEISNFPTCEIMSNKVGYPGNSWIPTAIAAYCNISGGVPIHSIARFYKLLQGS